MRKLILTVMASLLSCSAAQAFWPEATDSSLEIGVGYRTDRLKWKTSADFHSSCCDYSDSSYYDSYYYDSYYYDSYYTYGDESRGPNFHSDLEWKNLNIWQIEIRGKYVTCDNIYLRGSADYGWITSGKNTDKDFVSFGYDCESSREFASSHSKVKGNVYDVKFAVGYQFQLCDDTFSVSPLIGYSWHGQHFRDSHLRQSCCSPVVFDGAREATRSHYYSDCDSYSYDSCYSYGGDHSKFNTRWNGPFIGFDFDYSFACDWNLFGGYEFHWAQYHAKAHWDLRSDLCRGFNQHAKNAYGSVFDIGVKWDLCDCWTLALRGEFQWWYAKHGRDKAQTDSFCAGNVRKKCYIDIPVRNIRWDSAAIMFDVGMDF